MRVNVDGQRFNVPDDATPEEIDQISKPVAAVKQSPHDKMIHAIAGVMPRMPGETDAEHQQGVGGAVGAAMGMTMPNPLPFVGQFLKGSVKAVAEGAKKAAGSMFPKAIGAGEAALDPVLQQAPRSLPALPKVLEHVPYIGGPAKAYNAIRGAAEAMPAKAQVSPYPTGPSVPQPTTPPAPWQMPAPPPPAAPVQLTPELQAAAQASRARVLARLADVDPVMSAASPAPQSVLPQGTQAAQAAPQATAAAAPVTNIFEAAGRGAKVKELVKAVDANASAHLGVDPLDPRFAEAIGSLPQEWWHGMAQVAKVNKPSADTIKDTVAFFRDRAAQAVNAVK